MSGSIEKVIQFDEYTRLSSLCANDLIYVAGRFLPKQGGIADTTWVKCFDMGGIEKWEVKNSIDTSYREITSIEIAESGHLIGTGWVTVNSGEQKHVIIANVITNQSNIRNLKPTHYARKRSETHANRTFFHYDLLGRIERDISKNASISIHIVNGQISNHIEFIGNTKSIEQDK